MRKYSQIIHHIKYLFEYYPREFYVFGFFGIFLFTIIINLFSFTVINNSYYKNLADKQQISTAKNPISRGSIYSSNEVGKVLATSVDLNDLAVDPSLDGNKEKLGLFLTDVVYNEICYLKSFSECKKSLTKFLGVLDLPDFRFNEVYLRDQILQRVKERIFRTKVTSVLLKDNLTLEQAFELEKLNLFGVYINGTNLYVNPEEIIDEDFIASKLSFIIGIDSEDLKHLIKKKTLRYLPILQKLSITTSENLKTKINEEKGAYTRGFIKKEDLIYPFIILSTNQHRFYPENDMASTIIGFVDNEGEGKYGIEGYYNHVLKGKDSQSYSKKDIMGRLIEPMNLETQSALVGANITLTIDRNIQKKVEEIIDIDILDYQANNISVVIMEPKTGNIIAMASNPRFNLNFPGDAFELEKVTPLKFPNPYVNLLGARVLAIDNINGNEYFYDGKTIFLREINREELDDWSLEKYVFVNRRGGGVYKNDIIQDLYEPGSIFKPIVFAAAIDTGELNRYDIYKDDGFLNIDNFTIKNVSSQCLGYKTFQNAMNYSCNVGMIRIAQRIGASIFHKYLDSFGIGKKTGITLEGEVFGKLDPYEKWSRAQLFTTSFGQGITTTVLQMASVYSVLANGGIYYNPQIVKSIDFADGRTIVNKPEPTHRVIKEETSKIMTEVLVDSVNNGVAKNGGVKGYSIAGKTGTAQIAYKGQYETGQASTMGFYAGYAPAEDPKFVMIVKIERPRSSIYGGETVARTFSRISEYLFNYYAIPPKEKK